MYLTHSPSMCVRCIRLCMLRRFMYKFYVILNLTSSQVDQCECRVYLVLKCVRVLKKLSDIWMVASRWRHWYDGNTQLLSESELIYKSKQTHFYQKSKLISKSRKIVRLCAFVMWIMISIQPKRNMKYIRIKIANRAKFTHTQRERMKEREREGKHNRTVQFSLV